jgi:hypothetical protein
MRSAIPVTLQTRPLELHAERATTRSKHDDDAQKQSAVPCIDVQMKRRFGSSGARPVQQAAFDGCGR